MGGFSALLTTLYSIRLVYLTFLSNTNSRKPIFRRAHEGSWNLVLPLILLALGSIFVGYLVKEVVWSFQITSPPIVSLPIKLLPVSLSLGGAVLVIVLYFYSVNFFRVPSFMGRIGYTFLYSAWQFNYVLNYFLTKKAWKAGHKMSYRTMDKGALELVGPKGISNFMIELARGLSNLQSGLVFNYALVILIGVAIFIWGVV